MTPMSGAPARQGQLLKTIDRNKPGRSILLSSAVLAASMLALSACMTHSGKDKDKLAEAETVTPAPDHIPTVGERLAEALNAKAQVKTRETARYRDPMVTASGKQIPLMNPAGTPLEMNRTAPPPISDAPQGIAGLVTQPTAVNANRTSIFSSAMPATAPQYSAASNEMASEAGVMPQGITPGLRSVYSAPSSVQAGAISPAAVAPPPPMPAQQQGIELFPADTSASNVPRQPVSHAASPMRPTADATPSRMMPAAGAHGHTIDSKEALMMAKMTASKEQQDGSIQRKPGQSNVKIMGGPMPKGLVPDVTITPGMAASLKQPIAFKPGAGGTARTERDKAMITNLPLHL